MEHFIVVLLLLLLFLVRSGCVFFGCRLSSSLILTSSTIKLNHKSATHQLIAQETVTHRETERNWTITSAPARLNGPVNIGIWYEQTNPGVRAFARIREIRRCYVSHNIKWGLRELSFHKPIIQVNCVCARCHREWANWIEIKHEHNKQQPNTPKLEKQIRILFFSLSGWLFPFSFGRLDEIPIDYVWSWSAAFIYFLRTMWNGCFAYQMTTHTHVQARRISVLFANVEFEWKHEFAVIFLFSLGCWAVCEWSFQITATIKTNPSFNIGRRRRSRYQFHLGQ